MYAYSLWEKVFKKPKEEKCLSFRKAFENYSGEELYTTYQSKLNFSPFTLDILEMKSEPLLLNR